MDSEYLDSQFEWPEYAVFGSVLGISVAIGIYYGFFGGKNKTNEEYLLGNRQMHPIPVALSLLCSYVSSVTLLGHPVEIYLYGTQLFMVLLCYIPLTLSLIYLYVPFYFNLQFTSVYEYMEWRFNVPIRMFLSVINVIYSIFYMAMVVLGPALALSFVTGINHHLLIALIFTVCIFYSSLGGIKAVLWTDSLQALIMFVSMGVVVGMGISKIGGMSVVWERAELSGRVNFFNVDPDPRTRHTIWTAIIGGYFTWLPMYTNQAQIQRYISLPSMKAVVQALLINLVGLWILMGLCYVGGLVMYSTYYKCDPSPVYAPLYPDIVTNKLKAVDQLLVKFMMDTIGEYPGLPGLFVAGITCAALSTVSSVVNSLAATIVEDYVKKFGPKLSDRKLANISKIISVVTGLLGFGFAFVAEQMDSIFSAATSLLGILGGPTLGIFIAGMFFPWVNTVGAICGLAVSLAFMTFLGVGSTIYVNQKRLPFQGLELDDSGCEHFNGSFYPASDWKNRLSTDRLLPDDGLTRFFSLSYLWYPAVGCILTVALGLLFSFVAAFLYSKRDGPKRERLFIPIIIKMWMKICPNITRQYVIFEKDEHEIQDAKHDLEKSKAFTTEEFAVPSDKLGLSINNSDEDSGKVSNTFNGNKELDSVAL